VSPVSATYGGIPGYVIFWVLFAIAVGLFAQRAYFLFRLMRLGKQENRFDRIGRGCPSVVQPENRHAKGPVRDRTRSFILGLQPVPHKLHHLHWLGRGVWTFPGD
jgi:hypothetical protein